MILYGVDNFVFEDQLKKDNYRGIKFSEGGEKVELVSDRNNKIQIQFKYENESVNLVFFVCEQ